MRKIIRHISAFILLVSLAGVCLSQRKSDTDRISDPATVSLASLFSQADIVAFVKIHSGDAQSYKVTLYEAEVLAGYKGAKEKDVIYFGPFIGYGVGEEYLVFLKKPEKRIGAQIHKTGERIHARFDANKNYYGVMYDGYSVMPVSYECFFDGKGADRCGYGVKFNIYQVELPSTLKAFPKDVGEFSPDKKWVRQEALKAALLDLKKGQ